MGNPTGAALPESHRQQAGAWISLIPRQSRRKSSAAPKAPDRAAGCPGAALGIPGDPPGSPGAGIGVGSAARHEQVCQFGIHQHSRPLPFTFAFNPGANPQFANQDLAPDFFYFFFPLFFAMILSRFHKEKREKKKKKVLIASQTSKAARDRDSPSQLRGAEGSAAAKRCPVSPPRFAASRFGSISARTREHILPSAARQTGAAASEGDFIFYPCTPTGGTTPGFTLASLYRGGDFQFAPLAALKRCWSGSSGNAAACQG